MNIIYDPEKHFLGKLCRHDHDWENSGFSLRYKNTKKLCVICVKEQEKRTYQRRGTPEYRKEQYQKHYCRNRDQILEKCKKRRKENHDDYLERGRIYREANREKIRAKNRDHYQQNHTKERERSQFYRQKNADKIRDRLRNYYQTPSGKDCSYRAKQKRRAIKNQCHSLPYKREDILNLFNSECAYCGSKDKLTLDHFIPLTKGGSDVQGNLLPACLSCNCSKRNLDAIEWYKKQSFFTQKRLKQILKILGKTESN